jgi:hypothetical protein
MRQIISLSLLVSVAFTVIGEAWAASSVRTNAVCSIRKTSECQSSCAAPPSCLRNCESCPDTCAKACHDIVFDNQGLQQLWKSLSAAQRELLLKGVTIEKKAE